MSEWLKPDILVITRFGKTPVHIEFFASVDELIEEDAALIDSMKRKGILILNSDDEDIRSFKNKSSNKTITYGTEGGSDIFASNYRVLYGIDKKGKFPTGIQFKVEYDGDSAPVVLMGVAGSHHIYPSPGRHSGWNFARSKFVRNVQEFALSRESFGQNENNKRNQEFNRD